jgi:hypothetical protein
MGYSVKANDIVKDVVIHRSDCGHVRKGGGEPGKYDQVHWEDFNTLQDAEAWVIQWKLKGYKTKHCGHCLK